MLLRMISSPATRCASSEIAREIGEHSQEKRAISRAWTLRKRSLTDSRESAQTATNGVAGGAIDHRFETRACPKDDRQERPIAERRRGIIDAKKGTCAVSDWPRPHYGDPHRKVALARRPDVADGTQIEDGHGRFRQPAFATQKGVTCIQTRRDI